jgi:midasin
MQELEESKEELKDLIDEYMQYLSIKEELTMQVDDRQQPDTAKGSNFTQDLAPFDLLE